MIRYLFLVASLFAAAPLRAGEAAAPKAEAPQSEEQKTLYALGVWLGQRVGVFNLSSPELKWVTMGLRDSALGQPSKVEMGVYGQKINDLAQSRMTAGADKRKKQESAFLEKAAKEPGTQRSESGLVYKELKPGKGESPKATDKVLVHYHGTLTDGTVFDSSVQRGQPIDFPLNGVIPCWTEGVQKMKVGGKARLICPSKIAYGDTGSPPKIPGGATLIFDVELLEIKK